MLLSIVRPTETLAIIAVPMLTGMPARPIPPSSNRIGSTFGSRATSASPTLRKAMNIITKMTVPAIENETI